MKSTTRTAAPRTRAATRAPARAQKPHAKAPRVPLSRDRIVTAALQLIDSIGLEQFTTRTLGKQLGCEAMAIYNHVSSKDELLDAVADRLMSKVEAPLTGDWIERARGLALSYRSLARIHPNAFPLLATRRTSMPSSFKFYDTVFKAAMDEGLDAFSVARNFRALANFCTGTGLYEINNTAFFASRGMDPKVLGELAAAYPSLTAATMYFTPAYFDALFEFGLEALLTAFRKDAARRP